MLCGWLSPEGNFYPCESYGHLELAGKLARLSFEGDDLSLFCGRQDDLLLNQKWLKLYQDGLAADPCAGTLANVKSLITDQQVGWINQQLNRLSHRQMRHYSMFLEV